MPHYPSNVQHHVFRPLPPSWFYLGRYHSSFKFLPLIKNMIHNSSIISINPNLTHIQKAMKVNSHKYHLAWSSGILKPISNCLMYVPSAPYNHPVQQPLFYANSVNQRHAVPVHESTGRYGVYLQSEVHVRDRQPLLPSHTSLSVSSTPVMYQMSAKRPPGDQSFIPAPQLASCLQKYLEGNIFTVFPNYFLEDIWPDSALPCPLKMDIFKSLTVNKIWDEKNDCFITSPIFTECRMAE